MTELSPAAQARASWFLVQAEDAGRRAEYAAHQQMRRCGATPHGLFPNKNGPNHLGLW